MSHNSLDRICISPNKTQFYFYLDIKLLVYLIGLCGWKALLLFVHFTEFMSSNANKTSLNIFIYLYVFDMVGYDSFSDVKYRIIELFNDNSFFITNDYIIS